MAGHCNFCDGKRIVLATKPIWHPAGTVVVWRAAQVIDCPACVGGER
jgi:hypothetical protein